MLLLKSVLRESPTPLKKSEDNEWGGENEQKKLNKSVLKGFKSLAAIISKVAPAKESAA